SKTYGGELKDTGKSVEQTSDGGYIIASSSRSFGWINPSAWFIKVDNQGQEMWTKKYGGWGHDHGHHILPTDDGGYIATGHCNREESQMEDTYLLKLDSEGDWKIDTKVNESTLVYTLKIHPNPSTGTIELFLELNSSNYIEINILNYSGSVVYQSSNDELHSTFSKKIDLQGFSKGIYLLTVSDGITLRTTKVILQ
ncbi:MAG: T9SS type A sorting domain-containing protein, partial [Bacteroidota bacterium]|nr:T9SS type A sorting domain-containing protein [Bacteroidota bacterium]